MAENSLSSFTMLSEHLYELFIDYIISGRIRAPPEAELIEMLPTFQYGAKTDRRALQCKFKSWAKRMSYENGYLMLVSDGKIIIPMEKCEALVMHMHSEEHNDIEDVIAKIRMNYSWTRKNFGMDRDTVVQSLMRNCQREECCKRVRLEFAKCGNSFCFGVPNYPGPEFTSEMIFGTPPSPSYLPYHYGMPLTFPTLFAPSECPFQMPFFDDILTTGYPMPMGNEKRDILITKNAPSNSSGSQDLKENLKEGNCLSIANITSNTSSDPGNALSYKFRKPNNVHDYKTFVDAARRRPKEFPEILSTEKTRFLSLFGLAPKAICSSRTLKMFRKELRFKNLANRECMIYRQRKILRDKNKLNKCSEKDRPSYLGIPSYKVLASRSSEMEKPPRNQTNVFRSSRKLNRVQDDDCYKKKRMKLCGDKRKQPVEIELITLESSDEESPETITPSDETSIKEGVKEVILEQVKSDRSSDVLLPEQSSLSGKETSLTQSDKNEKHDDIPKSELRNESNLTKSGERKMSFIQEFRKAIFNKKRAILPKISSSPSTSNNAKSLATQKDLSVLKLYTIRAAEENNVINDPSKFVLQILNPNQVAIRDSTPSFSLAEAVFPTSKQNISEVIYPTAVSKAWNSSRCFMIDKERKGTLYLIPQKNTSTYAEDARRVQSRVTPEFVPQVTESVVTRGNTKVDQPVRQLKPKDTSETENILSENPFKKEERTQPDMDEQMRRITLWIYQMRANVNPTLFTQRMENAVQKLMSQLEVGIRLVREGRKTLTEIEYENTPTSSREY